MRYSGVSLAILSLALLALVNDVASQQKVKRIVDESFFFGCLTKTLYRSGIEAMKARPTKKEFGKWLFPYIVTGECTMFRSGDEVFVTDSDKRGGLVRLRWTDATSAKHISYWTAAEAVE